MYNFFCNKRYDVSFSDFHKMIKLVLPTGYASRETRGFYRKDYMPCNIIAIRKEDDSFIDETNKLNELNIYCWLGAKGLTVLADNELTAQISFEVLKNIKQNPEEQRNDTFLYTNDFEEDTFISMIKPNIQYSVFKQMNYFEDRLKFLIKEANSDELEVIVDTIRKTISLSGAYTSLYTFIYMIIDKITRSTQEVSE